MHFLILQAVTCGLHQNQCLTSLLLKYCLLFACIYLHDASTMVFLETSIFYSVDNLRENCAVWSAAKTIFLRGPHSVVPSFRIFWELFTGWKNIHTVHRYSTTFSFLCTRKKITAPASFSIAKKYLESISYSINMYTAIFCLIVSLNYFFASNIFRWYFNNLYFCKVYAGNGCHNQQTKLLFVPS